MNKEYFLIYWYYPTDESEEFYERKTCFTSDYEVSELITAMLKSNPKCHNINVEHIATLYGA